MKFAHVSDVHLPTTKARLTEFFSKSLLSFLSWHHKRKRMHLKDVTDALVEDMRAQEPDHVCVTGDLANASFKTELQQANQWLKDLGPSDKISFVPGNHDALVKRAEKKKTLYFADWMQSDDNVADAPYIQRKGNVAFIGLDSAVATLPTFASGRLGVAQLSRLAKLLKKAGDEGLFRVVLIHHPPLQGMAKWRKALRDADQLEVVLQESGTELVLHGHNHYPVHKTLETVDGTAHVYGAGSSSMEKWHGRKSPAHYNIIQVGEDGFTIEQRIYDAEKQAFVAFNPQ